jgi:hypothetical protein
MQSRTWVGRKAEFFVVASVAGPTDRSSEYAEPWGVQAEYACRTGQWVDQTNRMRLDTP